MCAKTPTLFLCVLFVVLVQALCAQTEPQNGVSIGLAKERFKTVSHPRYNLAFIIPADPVVPVEGEEDIILDCLDNSLPLQVDFRAVLSQLRQVSVQGNQIPVDLRAEHLIIAPRYLVKGKLVIHISFIAGNRSLNRNPAFLYTLLVPDRARTLFPCFDQPDLKAVFTLTLTLPADWKALANAPVKDSTVEDDGKTRTIHFFPSDTIPTYLFSFAAGKFSMSAASPGGRMMHGYFRETDSTKIRLSLDSLFRIQSEALSFLEDYTGRTYPFKKFDFVAIPDFQFGGMEHVGAIQYKASSLFLDAGATQEQLNGRVALLSHETAHMWFGDLVTMRWFNDVWMKEVFANFMADKIAKNGNAAANYNLKFLTDHYPAAYAVDRTKGANPIRQQLDNLQEAGSLYGNIIYHKAPIMMRQLELLMGENPFRNGLREYLQTFAYGNASWPELIHILAKYTPADLDTWNNVWVNKSGRPVFRYRLQTSAGKITGLHITQQGEDDGDQVWPQTFSLTLVYKDHEEDYPVMMKGQTTDVHEVTGRELPRYILFNTNGIGYGVFPIDTVSLHSISQLRDPVMRASAYINAYENMLDGQVIDAETLLRLDLAYLNAETGELNIAVLLGQIQTIFWHFIKPSNRISLAPLLETTIWKTMQQSVLPNEKKQLTLAYAGIAVSKNAQDTLYKIWKNRMPPPNVKLSEDDYTGIACGLAIRAYPGYEKILVEQGERIPDPDRKTRFQYLQPALSGNASTRDNFFYTLQLPQNRAKESWVLTALGYLHHPLRTAYSEKYLAASLEWLEDIQHSGDVFFPGAWLQANFGNYQSASAAATVNTFLQSHPNYNPKLKEKILQATDNLVRATKLAK